MGKPMSVLIATIILGLSGAAYAETLTCNAYAGLNRFHYEANVDTESGQMTVTTQNGNIYRGGTTYSFIARTESEYYHLPVTAGQFFELVVNPGGGYDYALCVAERECYGCR